MKTATFNKAKRTAEKVIEEMQTGQEVQDASKGFLPKEFTNWPKYLRNAIQEKAKSVVAEWE